eukprot:161791_1
MRPIQIPNGVRLHLNIYINNYNAEGMDSNYEKLITDAKNSGQLSNFIQYSWGLTDIPVIGNIEYKHHESKDKIRNSMNIQIEDHAIQGNGIKEDEIMVIIDPDNENVYTVKFEHKPFGMEWTETENKRNLYVSEITVDGQADIAGVTMGSIVIGLNDIDVQNVGARGIHEKAVSFGLPLKVTFMRSNMNDKVENDDEKKHIENDNRIDESDVEVMNLVGVKVPPPVIKTFDANNTEGNIDIGESDDSHESNDELYNVEENDGNRKDTDLIE